MSRASFFIVMFFVEEEDPLEELHRQKQHSFGINELKLQFLNELHILPNLSFIYNNYKSNNY